MLVSIFVGACASASLAQARDRSEGGYSPAALADKREECTIKGQLSEVCLEFYTDIYIKYSPRIERRVQDDLSTCFYRAKNTERNGISRSSADTATAIFNKRADDAAYQNKYVDECILLTERLLPGWKKAAATDLARVAFLARVRGLISDDFTRTCGQGVNVGMGQEGDPFSIVGSHLSAGNKKVFFKATDPDGNNVVVLCNGYVVGKTKTGKSIQVAPSSFAQISAERNRSSAACLDQCLHTSAPDPACYPEARYGVITAACAAHCRAECRR